MNKKILILILIIVIALGAYYQLKKHTEESQLKATVSSCHLSSELLVQKRRDALRLLSMGLFSVRTVAESESLVVRISRT